MEGSSYRFLDMGTAEGRAEAESYERSKAEKVRSGQQLYAKIKRSSKYYGQGEKGGRVGGAFFTPPPAGAPAERRRLPSGWARRPSSPLALPAPCLLYTSDAADERSSVDLGGRRIIKKKKKDRIIIFWQ